MFLRSKYTYKKIEMKKKAKHEHARSYFMAIIIFNVYNALFGDQRATVLVEYFFFLIQSHFSHWMQKRDAFVGVLNWFYLKM